MNFFTRERILCAVSFFALTQAGGIASEPVINDIAMVPRLTIQSDLGVTNQIQYNTDLTGTNWTTITNLYVTESPYWFVDASAPVSSQRFYRVVAIALPPQNIVANSGNLQVGVVGKPLANPLEVLVRDAVAHPVRGVTVTWAVITGGGSLDSSNSVTDGSGIAAMGATLGTAGGVNAFRATVAGLTGSPVTFTATAAKYIAKYSGDNQAGVAGTQLANLLTVKVTDNAANPVAGITVTWAVITGGGSLDSSSSVTDYSGIAAMSATLGPSPGTNTFTATVSGLTGSPITFTATGM